MDVVTRLVLLCRRPLRLAADDADQWLQSQVRCLLDDGLVAGIRFVALSSASIAWGRQWDHLIEIDLIDGADPNEVVRTEACAGLLGDLRLLGMQPTVFVADDERAIALTPEHR